MPYSDENFIIAVLRLARPVTAEKVMILCRSMIRQDAIAHASIVIARNRHGLVGRHHSVAIFEATVAAGRPDVS